MLYALESHALIYFAIKMKLFDDSLTYKNYFLITYINCNERLKRPSSDILVFYNTYFNPIT
jgi:hypothetical protein